MVGAASEEFFVKPVASYNGTRMCGGVSAASETTAAWEVLGIEAGPAVTKVSDLTTVPLRPLGACT